MPPQIPVGAKEERKAKPFAQGIGRENQPSGHSSIPNDIFLQQDQMPPQILSAAKEKRRACYRITELPVKTTKKSLLKALQLLCPSTSKDPQENAIRGLSIAPDPYEPKKYSIATVSFLSAPDAWTKCSDGSDINVCLDINGTACDVHVDSNFIGITTLHCHHPAAEYVSRAFGRLDWYAD